MGAGGPRHAALLPIASRAFETQMTRLEAEFVRREAPPSYGQLIAQGLIPPVEDFPVYSASQVSTRGRDLRGLPRQGGHARGGQPAAKLGQGSREAGGEVWAG